MINLLVVSKIVPVAIELSPAFLPGSASGIFKFIVNVSFPSTMLSFLTVMFTMTLSLSAIITALCVVELKSMSPPI